jgi:hypothetical protein
MPLIGLLPWLTIETQRLVRTPYSLLFPLGWFILAGLVLFSKRSVTPSRRRSNLALVFLFLALITAFIAVGKFRPALAQAAFAFCFVAWGLVRLHPDRETRTLGLSTLLLATIPLPGGLFRWTESAGLGFVSALAEPVLDLFRIFHLYESPQLKLRDHSFNLRELLNNPISVQAIILLSIASNLLLRRSLAVGLMNVVSAVVWTIVGQLLLILTTASFSQNGSDITTNPTTHNLVLLGIGVFVVAMLLISDSFWNAVLSPIRIGEDTTAFRSTSAGLFNRLMSWPGSPEPEDEDLNVDLTEEKAEGRAPVGPALPIGCLIGLLFIPSAMAAMKNKLIFGGSGSILVRQSQFPEMSTIGEDFILGQSLRRFRGANPSDISGEFGGNWTWQFVGTGGNATEIRYRFPVTGWSDAYAFEAGRLEWKRESITLVQDNSGWPAVESILRKQSGAIAYLWSSQFQLSGEPYTPTMEEVGTGEGDAPKAGGLFSFPIFGLMNPSQNTVKKWTAQVNMVYEGLGEIRQAEHDRMLAKYFESRELFRQRMISVTPN